MLCRVKFVGLYYDRYNSIFLRRASLADVCPDELSNGRGGRSVARAVKVGQVPGERRRWRRQMEQTFRPSQVT